MGIIIKLAAYIICIIDFCYLNLFSSLVPEATAMFQSHDTAQINHPTVSAVVVHAPSL